MTDNRLEQQRFRHFTQMWGEYMALDRWAPLDKWLKFKFAERKSFGKKDRAFYAEHFFSMMRRLCELVDDDAAFISGVTFRRALKELGPEEVVARYQELSGSTKIDAEACFPRWYEGELAQRSETSHWSDEQEKEFKNVQTVKPPTWLRANNDEAKEAIKNDFSSSDIKLRAEDQLAMAVEGQSSLQRLPSFEAGRFEFQDWSSQQVALALNIKPGMMVWDVCAGGGGKTLHCAALLRGKGIVYASEIREHKIAEIRRRAKRAKFFNIETTVWDGGDVPSFGKPYKLYFDRILVDAPCSGSGTWRRNPDGKFRAASAQDLAQLQETQANLLRIAAPRLRSSGLLVYATCSWLVSENEDVVAKFSKEHSDLELVRQELVGAPTQDADTMFIAVWRKRGGAVV